MIRHSWRILRLLPLFLVLGAATAAMEPPPVMVRGAPGRFEVAAIDASLAHAVVARAEEIWRHLAGVFALPEAFSVPIFVRITPEDGPGRAPFSAAVEPGGVVSVRLGMTHARSPQIVRRALVRGLLLRLKVAAQGTRGATAVPRWLEHGAALWCDARAVPARLDALKYESQAFPPPVLADLLAWREPDPDSRAFEIGGFWLLTFLQEELGDRWAAFSRQLLVTSAADALADSFPETFGNELDRELWWQTGWHHVSRARVLPTLAAAESRRELEMLARFVVAPEEQDVLVPMVRILGERHDGVVAAELDRRVRELRRLLPALHPFYRNAGLSLMEAFAADGATSERREALCAAFDNDWRDATELEAATRAALDQVEERGR